MTRKNTPSYLLIRSSGYYFRVRVPCDLRDHLTLSEIKSVIGHTNRAQALKVARRMSVITESLFDEIRENPYLRSADEIKAWRKQHLGSNQAHIPPSLNACKTPEQRQSPLFQQVVEKFVTEQTTTNQWTEKSRLGNEAIYRLAIRVIGDIPMAQITFEHVRNYKDTLCRLPANLNKNPRYRNKSIDAVLALKPTPMAVNTINKNLSRLSSIFKWAVKHGYTDRNYAEGIQLKTSKRPDEEREVYTKQDLEVIFKSEIYAENKYKYPYHFWLPLLGLYTGARLNELCQLYLEDIQQRDGIWVFDINENSRDKRLKSKAARRCIPIHPILIEAGLLTYVSQLKERQESRLFPELRNKRDGYGHAASKWYGRLRSSLGIRDKDFHSFRHTIANNLREQGVSFEDIADIVGHSNESTTARYTKQLSPGAAKKVINKVNYGIDLKYIKYFFGSSLEPTIKL